MKPPSYYDKELTETDEDACSAIAEAINAGIYAVVDPEFNWTLADVSVGGGASNLSGIPTYLAVVTVPNGYWDESFEALERYAAGMTYDLFKDAGILVRIKVVRGDAIGRTTARRVLKAAVA